MRFRQIEVTKEKLGTGAVLYYGKVWSSYFMVPPQNEVDILMKHKVQIRLKKVICIKPLPGVKHLFFRRKICDVVSA